jgi:hypothetical protein
MEERQQSTPPAALTQPSYNAEAKNDGPAHVATPIAARLDSKSGFKGGLSVLLDRKQVVVLPDLPH